MLMLLNCAVLDLVEQLKRQGVVVLQRTAGAAPPQLTLIQLPHVTRPTNASRRGRSPSVAQREEEEDHADVFCLHLGRSVAAQRVRPVWSALGTQARGAVPVNATTRPILCGSSL